MPEIAISLPFRLDNDGTIVIANTQEKIWGDRVRGVIGTTFRERVMRPNFGTSLIDKLYTELEEAKLEIEAIIETAFDALLSDLTLVNVEVTESLTEGKVDITITYQLPNEKESEVNIGFIQIDGNNPFYEQLLSYQERLNDQQ